MGRDRVEIEIVRLDTVIPRNAPPVQCQAVPQETRHIIETQWRRRHYGDRPGDHDLCQRVARFRVDDEYLCRIHAGQRLLHIHLGETK